MITAEFILVKSKQYDILIKTYIILRSLEAFQHTLGYFFFFRLPEPSSDKLIFC